MGCNQCFYNRPNAFYADVNEPIMPTMEEVGDKIVRVNSGHDSNIDRDYVIKSTEQYPNRFFNTSIPKLDFPAPVVLTINAKEEREPFLPQDGVDYSNLMFVRIRVSASNLFHVDAAIMEWTSKGIPVVLTFMAYYEYEPFVPGTVKYGVGGDCYEWRIRTLNSYWCATPAFIKHVLEREKDNASFEEDKELSRLVTICGGKEVQKCAKCKNCETYYWQTIKRMKGE